MSAERFGPISSNGWPRTDCTRAPSRHPVISNHSSVDDSRRPQLLTAWISILTWALGRKTCTAVQRNVTHCDRRGVGVGCRGCRGAAVGHGVGVYSGPVATTHSEDCSTRTVGDGDGDGLLVGVGLGVPVGVGSGSGCSSDRLITARVVARPIRPITVTVTIDGARLWRRAVDVRNPRGSSLTRQN